jgi:hypothetical protein
MDLYKCRCCVYFYNEDKYYNGVICNHPDISHGEMPRIKPNDEQFYYVADCPKEKELV